MSVTLYLRHGDCVQVLGEHPDESVGAVVSDPPYGLEFMGKEWDRLDWTMQGSFTEGGSSRFKNSPPLPSYGSATSENRICRTCKGSERGQDRVGFKKCRCASPEFPERKVKASDIGSRIQASHALWLSECYRVLVPGGVLKAFSATRTFHRMGAAMQEAGFTEVEVEAWAYGSGFPKSLSIGKAIDRVAGVEGGAWTDEARRGTSCTVAGRQA
jgi:DNA modification methylase